MDPYTIAAGAMKQIIDTEFTDLGIVAIHDELHEALGNDGPMVGIAPDRMAPAPNTRVAQHVDFHVQWFEFWEKVIEPGLEVDPRLITQIHDRLMRAVQRADVVANNDHWFIQWQGTDFPRDPVGNKTRFVASFRAWADNSALVETRA